MTGGTSTGADRAEWDARYAGADQMWSGRPNVVLATEAPTVSVGRALDVGCGEGADAVWLAVQGWEVTACDVSEVALARAGAAAGAAGVAVRWVRAGLLELPADPRGFDLVTVHYPALRRTPGRVAERSLVDRVAVGGTLLVVHHADLDAEVARAHGFDPEEYVQHEDVRAVLGDGWHVEVSGLRPRDGDAAGHHRADLVLRARRLPTAG